MSLSIGNSYFIKENISFNDMIQIQKKESPPELTLWEKIKDFFFSTGREKAQSCIFNLCNPTEDFNFEKAKEQFLTLKELASEEYKYRFLEYYYTDTNGITRKTFELKNDDWTNLIKLVETGNNNSFIYEILNKKIIIDNPLIEDFSPELPKFATVKKIHTIKRQISNEFKNNNAPEIHWFFKTQLEETETKIFEINKNEWYTNNSKTKATFTTFK